MFFYLIYKTTNKLNGKYYIGQHVTQDLDDGYLGSGKRFGNALRKYGAENFEREILHFCESFEEMNQKEAEIVTEEVVNDPMSYNLMLGGKGNWYFVNQNYPKERRKELGRSWKKTQEEYYRKNPEAWKLRNERLAAIVRADYASGKRKPVCSFTGRQHTEETKQKMSAASKGKQAGEKNSQFGKVWMYSEAEQRNMKVPAEEVEKYIAAGWLRGRKSR